MGSWSYEYLDKGASFKVQQHVHVAQSANHLAINVCIWQPTSIGSVHQVPITAEWPEAASN